MHRAKHRAAGSDAAVLATTLIERFAVVPTARPRHGTASPVVDGRAGSALVDALPYTAPTRVVPDDADRPAVESWSGDDAVWQDVPIDGARPGAASQDVPIYGYDEGGTPGASPLFGAARHARLRGGAGPADPAPRVAVPAVGVPVPAPRVSGTSPGLRAVRSQPVGTAISATVLGAAAAVTAVVVPAPSAVESTGSMLPVQGSAPAPAPVSPIGHALAAPAPLALPDQPTVQIPDLVNDIRAQMAKAAPTTVPTVTTPYATVASTTALGSSPSAMMRRGALMNALGRLGKPYQWGAMGPNAFDCSGLVKWSFANVGRSLPRTSRAMAGVGVPVARRDLQPGDLVFFYQPISHVGIYLGNNKIVHASQTGQPVKVSDITYMRFTAARRIV